MADPRIPLVVAVKSDNETEGHTVIVRNLTNGGNATGTMDDKGQVAFDMANVSSWAAGDKIVVERHGKFIGTVSHTVQDGKNIPQMNLVCAADAKPAISL